MKILLRVLLGIQQRIQRNLLFLGEGKLGTTMSAVEKALVLIAGLIIAAVVMAKVDTIATRAMVIPFLVLVVTNLRRLRSSPYCGEAKCGTITFVVVSKISTPVQRK